MGTYKINFTSKHAASLDSRPTNSGNNDRQFADIAALDSVKLYPTLAAAAMRGGRLPELRVYLLLRSLDAPGRGGVDVAAARWCFTSKHSPYRFVGWKRLRQILAAGAGVFWERDTRGRVWLKSAARIAAGLGVEWLTGAPVAVPVKSLLSGQESAAALYAAWHASRGDEAGPISRIAIREALGRSEASQRNYDRLAGVKRQKNIVLLGGVERDSVERHAWERGRGVFILRDYYGRHGTPGALHLAANLPASYLSPLKTLPHGRQRRANRTLKHLVSLGRGKVDSVKPCRVYHDDGDNAGRAYNRDCGDHDHYWRLGPIVRATAATPPRLEGVTVWGCIFKKQ